MIQKVMVVIEPCVPNFNFLQLPTFDCMEQTDREMQCKHRVINQSINCNHNVAINRTD